MALTSCPVCRNRISDRATACPRCGHPSSVFNQRAVELPSSVLIPDRRWTQKLQPNGHRLWLIALTLAACVMSPWTPDFAMWMGIAFLALSIGTFVPGVKRISQRLLKLNPSQPWRLRGRILTFGMLGITLVALGMGKSQAVKGTVSAVSEDRSHIPSGKDKSAVSETKQNETPLKNELPKPQPDLSQIRLANARVVSLIQEANRALELKEFDTAKLKIADALVVPNADQLYEAKKLGSQVTFVTDLNAVREWILELPDALFQQLKPDGPVPQSLQTGHPILDQRLAEIIKTELPQIIKIRKQRDKEELNAQKAEEKRAVDSIPRVVVDKARLTTFVSPANGLKMQMLIVTLRNIGAIPIRVVDADIVALDATGNVISETNYTIYAKFDVEPGLTPGRSFTTRQGEGFIIPTFGVGPWAKSVKVRITEVLEQSDI